MSLDALEFAVSISQHHDAITGTEKQAVANDYARWASADQSNCFVDVCLHGSAFVGGM
jgi:hypothetical protein